jgi:hypothetical protein
VPRFIVVVVGIALSAGCASMASGPTVEELRAGNARSVIGRITSRAEVAANPRYSVNEDYTRAMTGAVGVLISQMRGTARYYDYWVKGPDEPQYTFHSLDELPVGSCIRLFIPRDKEGKRGWVLNEVAVEKIESCL